MSLKMFLGIFFIVAAIYFFIGHPENDLWPTVLGPHVVAAYSALIKARPYTTILSFVFGIAFLMTIKKP